MTGTLNSSLVINLQFSATHFMNSKLRSVKLNRLLFPFNEHSQAHFVGARAEMWARTLASGVVHRHRARGWALV